MSHLIDVTGQRFGRLVVVKRAPSTFGKNGAAKTMWECKCDCGNTTIVRSHHLRNGLIRSCGCLLAETVKRPTSHGGSKERLYKIWGEMKRRCNNPNSNRYEIYGGRGISVCDEWEHDYAAFRKWALDNGYNPNAKRGECTLDRIDNDGNYEPENCRWVNMAVQCSNRHAKGYLAS